MRIIGVGALMKKATLKTFIIKNGHHKNGFSYNQAEMYSDTHIDALMQTKER